MSRACSTHFGIPDLAKRLIHACQKKPFPKLVRASRFDPITRLPRHSRAYAHFYLFDFFNSLASEPLFAVRPVATLWVPLRLMAVRLVRSARLPCARVLVALNRQIDSRKGRHPLPSIFLDLGMVPSRTPRRRQRCHHLSRLNNKDVWLCYDAVV